MSRLKELNSGPIIWRSGDGRVLWFGKNGTERIEFEEYKKRIKEL